MIRKSGNRFCDKIMRQQTDMSLLDRFRHAVATGALKADEGQDTAAAKLQTLAIALAVYRPQRFSLSRAPVPRGLYL